MMEDFWDLAEKIKLENEEFERRLKARHQDWGRRGIKAKGSESGAAKLTEEVVSAIRARVAAGEKMAHLAPIYGVNKSTIRYAVKRGWNHVK